MKICFLADADSIHTKRWCAFFSELGHEVHLISFKSVAYPQQINLHTIDAGKIDVRGRNWKVLLKYKTIRKLIDQLQPDIIHAHYATSYGMVGALVNRHPYVVTALGSDVLVSPNQSFVYRRLLAFVFKRADWLTAMADHMKTKMMELGADKSKIDVVPFGIDARIFNANDRKEDFSKFTIVSTRNFEPVYNLLVLIDAVAIFKEKFQNFELHLIGTGSQRELLASKIKELGLTNFVTFHGRIEQSEIAQQLKKSQLFITVSLSDGNNISLNEAMACGTFCIASAIPANTQWIKDGENGFLIPTHDTELLAKKIEEVYSNYKSLQEKAQPLNYSIVEQKANWVNNMKQVEKQYLKLIKR